MCCVKDGSSQFLALYVRLALSADKRCVSQVPASMYITCKHKQGNAASHRATHFSLGSERQRRLQCAIVRLDSQCQLLANKGKGSIVLMLIQGIDGIAHGRHKA